MHNTASVLENETHKLLWDFDIQTDQLISARQPDLIIIIKIKWENLQDCGLCCSDGVKLKQSKKNDKYLDLAKGLKKLWNMKVTVIPIVISTLGAVTKGLVQDLGDLEIIGRVDTI